MTVAAKNYQHGLDLSDIAIALSVVASTILAGVSGRDAIVAVWEPAPIEARAAYEDAVSPGQTINVQWNILKRTDCPGEASRVWRGTNGFYMSEPRIITALPKSKDWAAYNVQTKIPDLAPAGHLELNVVGRFECDGEAPRHFSLGPVSFTVAN